jgi:uncharacterized protein YqhQ
MVGEDEAAELEISGPSIWLAMLLAVALAVGLFFFLPLGLAQLLGRLWLPLARSSVLFSLTEGILRLGVFLAYLLLIGRLPDVKRFFQYHGAEHKAIHAFEAGEPLEVRFARAKSPLHPRCGTSFLMTVMVMAILIISLTPHQVSLGEKAAWRLAGIPIIAAISFEIIRGSVRRSRGRLGAIVAAPGLLLQRLTTREPTDDQIDVALAALRSVDFERQQLDPVPPAAAAVH